MSAYTLARPDTAVLPRQITQNHLKRLIDALPHPTALYDTAARALHTNASLNDIMRADSESPALLEWLRKLGKRLALQHAYQGNELATSEEMATSTRVYRVRAQLLEGLISLGSTTVMTVEMADQAASPDDLRAGYGLTEQEARVALLLAERATTNEIADTLSITKNTVRRHIERVLAKLNVSARTDVRERVMTV